MSALLEAVIGAETLAAFEAPGPLARGLTSTAYTSEAFFALEKERLFPRSWVFAGFAHELPRAGDAMPVSVAGKPLLLVRDGGKRIRVFHNVCRHRCLKLVDKPRNVGQVIRCPYHSWTYSLDGSLRITPYFGGRDPRAAPPGFDRAEHGLVPVRSETWHDWIFVNLDGGAPPFEDFKAPLERQLDGLDLSGIHHLATIDLGEVPVNWKLLMENFIEPYHVQFVHSTTTEQPLTDHYLIKDTSCLGCAVDVSGEAAREGALSVSARYLTLFPNFVFGRYFPNEIGVQINLPIAPDRSLQRRAVYSIGPEPASAEQTERIVRLWREVHREDHEMCERLQQGRASDVAAGGGVLSPVWEDSVRAFQELVVDSLR